MAGPLEGLLVVALEQAVAAPYCTRLLADAGARVVKLERGEGDFARGYDRAAGGQSSYFVWLNRGKESLALDVKQPADRALLDRLLAKADVFVQNMGPGAAARLGLDGPRLRAAHPRLVTCSIAGFGDEGPFAHRKAYDLIVQAETGLASVTGTPEGPGRVGVSICDIATGALAQSAILEALIARGRTGEGEDLHLSLFDTIAEWMSVPYAHARYGAGDPARVGLAHPSIAPYGAFETSGAPILVAVQNEREWRRFCAIVMDAPEMADDPRFSSNVARVDNRAALDGLIAGRFASLERDVLTGLLEKADMVFGSVNTVTDFLAHPQIRRQAFETEAGTVELPAVPARRSPPRQARTRVPSIGEHSAAIRAEFAD